MIQRLRSAPVVGAIAACALAVLAARCDGPVMGDPDGIASALEAAQVSDWDSAKEGDLVAARVVIAGDQRFCLTTKPEKCARGAGGVREALSFDTSHADPRGRCRRTSCETIFTLTAKSRWNFAAVDSAFADDFEVEADFDFATLTLLEYLHHLDMTYDPVAANPADWRERGGLATQAEVLRVLPAGVHTLIGVRRNGVLAPIEHDRLANDHQMVLGAPGKRTVAEIAERARRAWEPTQPRWLFPGVPTAALFVAGVAAFFLTAAVPIMVLGDRWGSESAARAAADEGSTWKDRFEDLSPWAWPCYFAAVVALLRFVVME